MPMTAAAYRRAVEDLVALARFHRRGTPHPYPPAECLFCDALERQRRDLAQQCPASLHPSRATVFDRSCLELTISARQEVCS